MRSAPAIVALTALAGLAHAQGNFSWYGIPDFDQRRSGALWDTGSGLPGNGGWYCVPTSMVNIMAYLSNQGFPQAMNRPGPSNWAHPNDYYWVSGYLTVMGQAMGTGSNSGTGSQGWQDGVNSWLAATNLTEEFSFYWYGSYPDWTPSPIAMLVEMDYYGSLLAFAYGPYENLGGSTGWSRTGGHICTISGISDVLSNSPTLRYKDPWTGDVLTAQSAFSTATTALQGDFVRIHGEDRLQWRMVDISSSSTRCYIDEMTVLRPNIVFTGTSSDNIQFHRLFRLGVHRLFQPDSEVIAGPGGRTVARLADDPSRAGMFVVSNPEQLVPPRLYFFDPSARRYTQLMNFSHVPTTIETDRRGDVFLIGDGSVRRLRMIDGAVEPISEDPTAGGFDDIAIDDATDAVHLIDGSTRVIRSYGLGDLSEGNTVPLDSTVPLTGKPSIAINPADGALWLASEGVAGVRKLELRPPPTGGPDRWYVDMTASHTNLVNIEDLQFSNTGRIQVLTGGRIRVVYQSGRVWIADTQSPMWGLPAKNFLVTSRSRTNFDPDRHTGPGWDTNVFNPPRPATEQTDCAADMDSDGFVAGPDFDLFVAAFEAGNTLADFDFDGFITGIDFDLYVEAFEAGC